MEWWIGHGTDVHLPLGRWGDIGYLTAGALLIDGLVRKEQTWRIAWPDLWKILGGASYTLYLIHQPLASVLIRSMRQTPPEESFMVLVLAAVATAILLHLFVERPLLGWLGRLGAGRTAKASIA
jgi:peptidoglycan/LPS O-acetylase OafA/YrhL